MVISTSPANRSSDPKLLDCAPCTSSPRPIKKSVDSAASLRRRRLEKCCPLRHCSRALHTGRRKRRKAPSSFRLRVSQETLIDCWNVDNMKETEISKCDCKNSNEFQDDFEDKELPGMVKQNTTVNSESKIQIVDEFCDKRCYERLKKYSTNIATAYSKQSTAKSQRQKINKAEDTNSTEERLAARVNRSNSTNLHEIANKGNVIYVQSSAESFTAQNTDQGNKGQDPDLINRNNVRCPVKTNSCKCNARLYDTEFIKCEDTLTYVPKDTTKILDETQENLSAIETRVLENHNTVLHSKERRKSYSTGQRISSGDCVGNSKGYKPKYHSKSDSENLKNTNVCKGSNLEYERTRGCLDNVSVQLTRTYPTTSSSSDTSIADYEHPLNDNSSFATGKPFHSTEIEIDSRVQQNEKYPTTRKKISTRQDKFSKYLCKNCSTNTRSCERSLFRTEEMSTPEASCDEKISSYRPQVYQKSRDNNYLDDDLDSERSASMTDHVIEPRTRARFSARKACSLMPSIDKSASVIFENSKTVQNESGVVENTTSCSLCLSSSSNPTRNRHHDESPCWCDYRGTANRFVSTNQRDRTCRASSSSSCLSSRRDYRRFDSRGSTSCTNICGMNSGVKRRKTKCPKQVTGTISFSSSSSSSSPSTSAYGKAKRRYGGRSTDSAFENPSEADDTFEDETNETRVSDRKRMKESWENRNMRSKDRGSVRRYKSYRTKYCEEVLRENEAIKGRRKRRLGGRRNRVDDEPRFVCIPCDSVWEKIISVPE